MSPKMLH